jgi:amphi-Trp domain-containing protein
MAIKKKKTRDIEKTYPKQQFIDKLRRFADALESDSAFSIQISGERLRIPADSVVNIEHERSGELEEVEFQVKWKRKV